MKVLGISLLGSMLALGLVGCGEQNVEGELLSGPKVVVVEPPPPEDPKIAEEKAEAARTYPISRAQLRDAARRLDTIERRIAVVDGFKVDDAMKVTRAKNKIDYEKRIQAIKDALNKADLAGDPFAQIVDVISADKKTIDSLPVLESEVLAFYREALSHIVDD